MKIKTNLKSAALLVTMFLLFQTEFVNAQFQKHYPLLDRIYDRTEGIDNTSDYGYIVVGNSLGDYTYDPFLLKVDKEGNPMWLNYYEASSPARDGGFQDVKNIPWEKNTLAAFGQHVIQGLPTKKLLFSLIDEQNGAPVKSVIISPSGTSGGGIYGENIVFGNESYVLAGTAIKAPNSPVTVAVAELDQNLSLINSGVYEFKGSSQGVLATIKTSDNGYIVVGANAPQSFTNFPYKYRRSKSVFIMKLDQNLNYVWNKTVQISNHNVRGTGVIENADGVIFISGDMETPGKLFGTPFLLRMDLSGKIDWVKQYKSRAIVSGRTHKLIYDEKDDQLVMSCDFIYLPSGAQTFPVGYIRTDVDGVVVNSNLYAYGKYSGPGSYISYNPKYAKGLVQNRLGGFSMAAIRGYSNIAPYPDAKGGVVIIETDQTSSSQSPCEDRLDIKGDEIRYSEEDLHYLGKSSMQVSSQNLNYYSANKVIQVKCDETFEQASSGKSGPSQIMPNPASGYFSINTDSGIKLIRVMELNSSRPIIEIADYKRNDQIQLNELKSGIYLVEVTLENGKTEVHTLIKE